MLTRPKNSRYKSTLLPYRSKSIPHSSISIPINSISILLNLSTNLSITITNLCLIMCIRMSLRLLMIPSILIESTGILMSMAKRKFIRGYGLSVVSYGFYRCGRVLWGSALHVRVPHDHHHWHHQDIQD